MYNIRINPNNKVRLENLLNSGAISSGNLRCTLQGYLDSVDNASFTTKEAANLARISVLEGIVSLAFTMRLTPADYDRYRIFTAIFGNSLRVHKARS